MGVCVAVHWDDQLESAGVIRGAIDRALSVRTCLDEEPTFRFRVNTAVLQCARHITARSTKPQHVARCESEDPGRAIFRIVVLYL